MGKRTSFLLSIALCCTASFASETRVPASRLGTGESDGPRLARVYVDSGVVRFEPFILEGRYVLTVSGGDGFVSRQEYGPGEPVVFMLQEDDGSDLPDGAYRYQLRLLTEAGERGASREDRSERAGRGIGLEPLSQTGTFEIVDGGISPPAGDATPKDQVYPEDDHIFRGNVCVGSQCVDGETFPKDVLYGVLKVKGIEPTVRLDDVTGGDNDWQITADDGSSNEFAVTELTGSTEVDQLTIRSGARDNAIYVDSSGRVGLGVLPDSTAELHVLSTASEANIRLEEQGSGRKFTLSNYTSAFAVDGQVLDILKLGWEAPKYSIVAAVDGVGIGTDAPAARLHVRRSDGTAKVLVEDASGTEQDRVLAELRNNGGVALRFNDTSGPTTHDIRTGPHGLEVTGDFAVLSSRAAKEVVGPVEPRQVLWQLLQLPIDVWRYRGGGSGRTHIGPMAEDWAEAFPLGGGSASLSLLDANGVAVAAIQGLHEELRDRDRSIAALEAANAELRSQLAELSGLVARLVEAHEVGLARSP